MQLQLWLCDCSMLIKTGEFWSLVRLHQIRKRSPHLTLKLMAVTVSNSSKYHENVPLIESLTEEAAAAEFRLCLAASLKSHKAGLTLRGCQSITARPLLLEGRRGMRGGPLGEASFDGWKGGKKKKYMSNWAVVCWAEMPTPLRRQSWIQIQSATNTSRKLMSEAISRSPVDSMVSLPMISSLPPSLPPPILLFLLPVHLCLLWTSSLVRRQQFGYQQTLRAVFSSRVAHSCLTAMFLITLITSAGK